MDLDYKITSLLIDHLDQQAYAALLVNIDLINKPDDWKSANENILEMLDIVGTLEECLILASKRGMLAEVSMLFGLGVDPSARDNAAILEATKENRIDVVSLLLANPLVDPTVDGNLPYKIANRDGFYQLASVLADDPRVRALLT